MNFVPPEFVPQSRGIAYANGPSIRGPFTEVPNDIPKQGFCVMDVPSYPVFTPVRQPPPWGIHSFNSPPRPSIGPRVCIEPVRYGESQAQFTSCPAFFAPVMAPPPCFSNPPIVNKLKLAKESKDDWETIFKLAASRNGIKVEESPKNEIEGKSISKDVHSSISYKNTVLYNNNQEKDTEFISSQPSALASGESIVVSTNDCKEAFKCADNPVFTPLDTIDSNFLGDDHETENCSDINSNGAINGVQCNEDISNLIYVSEDEFKNSSDSSDIDLENSNNLTTRETCKNSIIAQSNEELFESELDRFISGTINVAIHSMLNNNLNETHQVISPEKQSLNFLETSFASDLNIKELKEIQELQPDGPEIATTSINSSSDDLVINHMVKNKEKNQQIGQDILGEGNLSENNNHLSLETNCIKCTSVFDESDDVMSAMNYELPNSNDNLPCHSNLIDLRELNIDRIKEFIFQSPSQAENIHEEDSFDGVTLKKETEGEDLLLSDSKSLPLLDNDITLTEIATKNCESSDIKASRGNSLDLCELDLDSIKEFTLEGTSKVENKQENDSFIELALQKGIKVGDRLPENYKVQIPRKKDCAEDMFEKFAAKRGIKIGSGPMQNRPSLSPKPPSVSYIEQPSVQTVVLPTVQTNQSMLPIIQAPTYDMFIPSSCTDELIYKEELKNITGPTANCKSFENLARSCGIKVGRENSTVSCQTEESPLFSKQTQTFNAMKNASAQVDVEYDAFKVEFDKWMQEELSQLDPAESSFRELYHREVDARTEAEKRLAVEMDENVKSQRNTKILIDEMKQKLQEKEEAFEKLNKEFKSIKKHKDNEIKRLTKDIKQKEEDISELKHDSQLKEIAIDTINEISREQSRTIEKLKEKLEEAVDREITKNRAYIREVKEVVQPIEPEWKVVANRGLKNKKSVKVQNSIDGLCDFNKDIPYQKVSSDNNRNSFEHLSILDDDLESCHSASLPIINNTPIAVEATNIICNDSFSNCGETFDVQSSQSSTELLRVENSSQHTSSNSIGQSNRILSGSHTMSAPSLIPLGTFSSSCLNPPYTLDQGNGYSLPLGTMTFPNLSNTALVDGNTARFPPHLPGAPVHSFSGGPPGLVPPTCATSMPSTRMPSSSSTTKILSPTSTFTSGISGIESLHLQNSEHSLKKLTFTTLKPLPTRKLTTPSKAMKSDKLSSFDALMEALRDKFPHLSRPILMVYLKKAKDMCGENGFKGKEISEIVSKVSEVI